jgi:hypothetical protein
MSMLLAAMLASSQALPWLDRAALERQARSETLRPAAVALAAAPPRRRNSNPRAMLTEDLSAISTVCRAAAKAPDPAEFLGRLGEAFAMPAGEVRALRKTCGAYLAGMADAQR